MEWSGTTLPRDIVSASVFVGYQQRARTGSPCCPLVPGAPLGPGSPWTEGNKLNFTARLLEIAFHAVSY